MEEPAPIAAEPAPTVRFAVIGDYGQSGPTSAAVAALVQGWEPDFIITVGDNNYPSGAAATIDGNIGRYYHRFISPYTGGHGAGGDTNRFFPTLGNHDWDSSPAAYLSYFDLPGNERYYTVPWGPVALFAVSSDFREPDGLGPRSAQGEWLREELAASGACWKIVYMHHPPYSSGHWGSSRWMQWPYAEWGADAVLAGHDHTYERILRDGIVYFVNGVGGQSIYRFRDPIAGTAARFNADFGAMYVEATSGLIRFEFITRSGELIDEYSIHKSCD